MFLSSIRRCISTVKPTSLPFKMAQQGNFSQEDMEKFFSKQAETYENAASAMHDIARDSIALAPPITSDSVILDNACGPGIVTGEIMKQSIPGGTPEFYAADYSEAMIKVLRRHDWASKVQASAMDARELKFSDNKFTHAWTNFAIMAIQEPEKVAKEIYRTLKPGGTAVFTTWKTLGYMVIFHDAQKKVKPESDYLPGPRAISAEWMSDTKLRSTIEAAGFQSHSIKISTGESVMGSDGWGPGLEMIKGMLIKDIVKGWSDEEAKEYNDALEKQFAHESSNQRPTTMVAWMAVARK